MNYEQMAQEDALWPWLASDSMADCEEYASDYSENEEEGFYCDHCGGACQNDSGPCEHCGKE